MISEQQAAMVHFRSNLLRHLRSFFDGRGYLEVDTPLLAPALIPESHIVPFLTKLIHPFKGEKTLYLVPSPEVYMKRLLRHGLGSIYQINRCFRNDEQIGREHQPEFTMLEWYTQGADYLDSLETAKELLAFLSPLDKQGLCEVPASVITVAEACWQYAGIDLEKVQRHDDLVKAAEARGLSFSRESASASWEEVFNRLFLTFVEPELPKDRPCFLKDYPAQIPCLAKNIPNTPWKQRWELYLAGRELANCYSEETDAKQVSAFFHRSKQEVIRNSEETGRSAVISDDAFPQLYQQDHPRCSGTALGIDRLIMALSGIEDIGGVILFPLSDIL